MSFRVTLESLASCFQGLLPAELFTCSRDGIPNAAYLSHVDYVDSRHVALSFQFFNKSRRNIAENPQAQVLMLDPDTGQGWRLQLHYVRSETSGPLFERMRLRIEAIASYCGLKGIFKLLASDVYEVLSVDLAEEVGVAPAAARRATGDGSIDPVFTTRALQELSARIHCADSLEQLLDSTLETLETSFGFQHSMILLPSEQAGTFVTIASRGYPENGAGAEVRLGEGIIGMVAEARKPIRISGLLRGMLYAWAMAHAHATGDTPPHTPERRIPLPGLANPESQLGVPLLVRGDLVGVLCLESEVQYRFHEEDKALIELLGSYLAIAIQNTQLREIAEAGNEGAASARAPASTFTGAPATSPAATHVLSGVTHAQPVGSHNRTAGPVTPAASPVARGAALASSAPAEWTKGGSRVMNGRTSPTSGSHEVLYYQSDECILVDGEYLIRSLPARILWKLLTTRESCGRVEFTNRELRLDKSLNLPEWKDNLESRLLLLRRRLEQKCPTIRLVPLARGRFALELGRDVTLDTRP